MSVNSNSLRLVMVLWNGNIGGAENLTVSLAKNIKSKGYDVRVVFIGKSGVIGEKLDYFYIPYQNLNLSRGSHVIFQPKRFARLVSSGGTNGVILQSSGYLAFALRLGGFRGKIVSIDHGSYYYDKLLPFYKKVNRRISRKIDRNITDIYVAVSKCLESLMRNRLSNQKIVQIYNGVDLSLFSTVKERLIDNKVVLGSAGRLIKGKGFDDLIFAMKEISKKYDCLLNIAGDGPERAFLEKTINKFGLSKRVNLLGWVQDMPKFWQSCDIAIVPSREYDEPFGVVTIEAMACGLPVIASNSGALVEIIDDGNTGFLYNSGVIQDLVIAIEKYLSNPEIRIMHGQAARKRCEEKFDINKCAEMYLNLFKEI